DAAAVAPRAAAAQQEPGGEPRAEQRCAGHEIGPALAGAQIAVLLLELLEGGLALGRARLALLVAPLERLDLALRAGQLLAHRGELGLELRDALAGRRLVGEHALRQPAALAVLDAHARPASAALEHHHLVARRDDSERCRAGRRR